jgi:hypothetical protein
MTVGGTFVLVEVGPRGPLFAKAGALLGRFVPPLKEHFARLPDEAVTVLFFTRAADYDGWSRATLGVPGPSNLGVYRSRTREIAADVSLGDAYLPTLTHEVVHPFLEADFPTAPVWFGEAVASLFEAPVFSADGGIGGVRGGARQARLLRALGSPTERATARLDALFDMSTATFLGASRTADGGHAIDEPARVLHYAVARSVASWLDTQGKLWPFYRAWRDARRGAEDDPTGERSFARVMGGSPSDLNERWVAWAKTQ